jgi:hypothetical protein
MDLKVEKSILLSEFNLLLQKLSLKVWNECCQVFLKKDDDNKDARSTGGTNKMLKSARVVDSEADSSKSLFVMNQFNVDFSRNPQANKFPGQKVTLGSMPNKTELDSNQSRTQSLNDVI